ncbi:TniQ family protein [Janibacter sp. G349]|uniref:TniQ family protein n=1 Tax=Janibacter sp. G349 TaxID=3405424 RepID=UPI003D295710
MSPDPSRNLPARPTLHAGQALDCYLEHAADANHIPPATVMRAITDACDTTRYVLLRPTPRTLEVLSGLTGQSTAALTAATLAAVDGTLLDLSGLDPHHQPSYRAVAARGWAPGQGTQICPRCLAETGTWDISWRIPTTTVCLRHRSYLLSTCPGCQRPFRATRSTLLRPIGAKTRCGNALGRRGHYCPTDLSTLPMEPADPGCVDRQARTQAQSLVARPPQVFGEGTTAHRFMADVHGLTALLLHIATATTRPGLLPEWAGQVHAETHTQQRAPRWGLKLPADISTRSRALTTTADILTSSGLEEAITRFAPWVEAIPRTPDGLLGWIGDHTRHTSSTTRLVMATHAPRRRLSHLLDATPPLTVSTEQIPQVLPVELYEEHLGILFTSRPETIQLFASLAMALTHPGITTWAEAAQALGLPPDLGPRCAAAAAASQTASPAAVLTAIAAAAIDLDGRDYRALEAKVRALTESSSWFTTWARNHRPGTRAASQTLVIQCLWTHVAHAHPATAPDASPARARRFAATLDSDQQSSLHQVVHHLTSVTHWGSPQANHTTGPTRAPTTSIAHSERKAQRHASDQGRTQRLQEDACH